jgi:hypothetical protein
MGRISDLRVFGGKWAIAMVVAEKTVSSGGGGGSVDVVVGGVTGKRLGENVGGIMRGRSVRVRVRVVVVSSSWLSDFSTLRVSYVVDEYVLIKNLFDKVRLCKRRSMTDQQTERPLDQEQ